MGYDLAPSDAGRLVSPHRTSPHVTAHDGVGPIARRRGGYDSGEAEYYTRYQVVVVASGYGAAFRTSKHLAAGQVAMAYPWRDGRSYLTMTSFGPPSSPSASRPARRARRRWGCAAGGAWCCRACCDATRSARRRFVAGIATGRIASRPQRDVIGNATASSPRVVLLARGHSVMSFGTSPRPRHRSCCSRAVIV